MKPSLKEEKKLWRNGYKKVVGVDEVGRGPLAGPVVACALAMDNTKLNIPKFNQIKDSKQLTEKQREEFYKILTKRKDIKWGIGMVSEKVIDRVNIFEATRLAMVKAVKKLKRPDFLILDGKIVLDLKTKQKSIVKADEKVFSCSCASIIAKVTRDRIMKRYSKKYPAYGFDKHKGYPTELHRRMIKKHGLSDIHRKSFKLA